MERQKLTPEMKEILRAHGIAGKSVAAFKRFANRVRVTLHNGKPGDVIEMSRGRKYAVAKDGSFRRLDSKGNGLIRTHTVRSGTHAGFYDADRSIRSLRPDKRMRLLRSLFRYCILCGRVGKNEVGHLWTCNYCGRNWQKLDLDNFRTPRQLRDLEAKAW